MSVEAADPDRMKAARMSEEATAPLRVAETAPLRMVETALPQPVRDGHRQLAPRLRPRPGRALRQPLLPGPRSSPFHIR